MSFVFHEIYTEHEYSRKRHKRTLLKIVLSIWAGLFLIMTLLILGFPVRAIQNLIPCGVLKNCEDLNVHAKAIEKKDLPSLTSVVRGTADTALTRGQMILYLRDMLLKRGVIDQKYVNDTLSLEIADFVDVPKIHPAYSASRVLVRRGILKGYAEDKINPDSQIKRSEMVALLARGLELPILVGSGAPHFKDIEPSHWFYRYAETLYSYGALRGDEFRAGDIATEGFLQEILGKL